LDPCASVADDYNCLPSPFILVAVCDDEVADEHDDDVGNHGGQSHFGLTDTTVPEGGSHTDPIAQRTTGEQSNDGANKNGKVEESDRLTGKIVRWGGEGL